MNKPFFTVVIPTYNRCKLLREALESVLAQTFGNFELIVVDDHSTDDTKDVVASFKDPRIKYILNDRTKGGAGTRNAGIFRANGDWVAFLDDDDIWLNEKLELQYEKIQKVDSSVGLIYSGCAAYDFIEKREVSVSVPEKEGWIQKDLLYKNFIAFDTAAIRTDLLKKVAGLDESFEALQDRELFVRIASISKVVFIKETLVYIRTSNTDRISTNHTKRLNGILLFWEKYKHLINENLRLRHRSASLVFVFAFKQGNRRQILSALPWTVAGLFIDIPNLIWVSRTIYYHLRTRAPV